MFKILENSKYLLKILLYLVTIDIPIIRIIIMIHSFCVVTWIGVKVEFYLVKYYISTISVKETVYNRKTIFCQIPQVDYYNNVPIWYYKNHPIIMNNGLYKVISTMLNEIQLNNNLF